MKKLPFAVFFIILVIGSYFVLSVVREGNITQPKPAQKNTTGYTSSSYESPSVAMAEESPYAGVFNSIVGVGYFSWDMDELDRVLYREYLWPNLDQNTSYPCNLSGNTSFTTIIVFLNQTMQDFINASEESVRSGNTVEALLLGDMMNENMSLIETVLMESKNWSNNWVGGILAQEAYTAACIIKARIKRINIYERMALKKYGEPPFNLSSLEELNDRIRPYLSYVPMNGTQSTDWRIALQNLIAVLLDNKSLLNRFSVNYTPQKAADLLSNFTKKVNSNPYLKSVFKPVLIDLVTQRDGAIDDDVIRHKGESGTAIDMFYLKVFYAWYNIVKPYTLWR